MQIRFGASGILTNIVFVILYNEAVAKLEQSYAASTIYAVIYFLFIPLGHALTCLIVFGWPTKYFQSLMSNYPIGLTAILLGSILTAYLDRIGFERLVDDWVVSNFLRQKRERQGGHEFYSSLVVMFVTSVWTCVLSVVVNSPSSSAEKKKL